MTGLLNSKFCIVCYYNEHALCYTRRSKEDPGEDTHVPCVLLTGLSSSVVRKMKQVRKVVVRVSVPAVLIKILRSLGGEFTTDPTKSTHLVAPRVSVKYLSF